MKSFNIAFAVYALVVLAGLGGWVTNIIKLINTGFAGGLEVARAVGIIVAPLGAVLGFF